MTESVTSPPQQIDGQEYIIDPEIQSMFSPVTEERYLELKEAIRRDGVLHDLIVSTKENILLDGHTRHRICEELNIKPPVRRLSFASWNDAKMWVLQNQFIRRNMNVFQRIEAAMKHGVFFSDMAKANQRAAGGSVPQICGKAIDTNKELGKLAGTNAEMVRKVKKILKRATPAEIDSLRNDGVKIHTIFKKYKDKDKKEEEKPKATQPPPESNPNPAPDAQPSDEPESVAEPFDEPSIEHEPETILPLESNEEQSRSFEEQLNEYIVLLDEFVAERSLPEERVLIRERIREWANGGESDDISQPLE
jgi:hypothetical protein